MGQEKARDQVMIDRQVSSESDEIRDVFDILASLTNEYYGLKKDLIKVEAEVYEFGRILQTMPKARADKFKAKLWLAWHSMQEILKQFQKQQLSVAKVD